MGFMNMPAAVPQSKSFARFILLFHHSAPCITSGVLTLSTGSVIKVGLSHQCFSLGLEVF